MDSLRRWYPIVIATLCIVALVALCFYLRATHERSLASRCADDCRSEGAEFLMVAPETMLDTAECWCRGTVGDSWRAW